MTEEWKDCPTIEDVVEAKKRGDEIHVFDTGIWLKWDGEVWECSKAYRCRTAKPKMTTIKFECFVIDGELRWRRDNLSVLGHWVRVPSEDKTVGVPE